MKSCSAASFVRTTITKEPLMLSRLLPFALVASAVAGLACTEAPPGATMPPQPTAPEPATLIHRLSLGEGHTVEFWDASAAGIVVAEDGFANQPRAMRGISKNVRSAVELFKVLAPEREVPAELVGAEARLKEFLRTHARIPGAPKAGEGLEMSQHALTAGTADYDSGRGAPGTDDALCPASWFDQEFCAFNEQHYHGGCALGRRNGGYSEQFDDVNFTFSAVCPYRGTATYRALYRTWWSWSGLPTVNVPAGRFHVLNTLQNGTDYDFFQSIPFVDGIAYQRGTFTCLPDFECPF
jgi:hypothetical protein